MSESGDGDQCPVVRNGVELGSVWRIEPRQWAFKIKGAMLIRGFRSTKLKAVTALLEATS